MTHCLFWNADAVQSCNKVDWGIIIFFLMGYFLDLWCPPPPARPRVWDRSGDVPALSSITHPWTCDPQIRPVSPEPAGSAAPTAAGQLATGRRKNFSAVSHPSPRSFQVLSVLVQQDWISSSTFSISSAFRVLWTLITLPSSAFPSSN